MSGSAFNYWSHYKQNNHLDFFRQVFKDELGNETSNDDVFNFVTNAPTQLLVERTPAISVGLDGLLEEFWTPVIESKIGNFLF